MVPLLNRKMILEERSGTQDGAGGFAAGWTVLGTLWAELRPRTGRSLAHDEIAAATNRYRIVVRAAPAGAPSRPKPGQRLIEGARVFDIKSVADFDTSGQYLSVFAEEEVAK